MGSKKLQIWLPLILSIVMVIGMMIGFQLRDKSISSSFWSSGKKSSVQEVMDLVKNKYVDDIKADSINQIIIDQFLSQLDPHSVYIPAVELKDVNEELMGNFQGIGVEFQMFNDTLNIVNVIKGGPSEKAGILVGDEIIKVNDTVQLAGKKISPDNIRKQLRGLEGSSVKVTILRESVLKDIIITRGTIPVSSIDAAYIIAPSVGYIRVNKFAEHTYREFMNNLENLQKQGMQKLILDLRGNGGGLLSEAINMADEFLDEDKLIVYTEGNHSTRKEYHCQRDGLFEKGALVVLVDETSASASEVLTGALQDWDRATIIGRRTFGKGLVQQQFSLSDGSAVRLTIARYYTPLGRNIQKSYSSGKEKYEAELFNRFHDGELVKPDSSKLHGKPYKTPNGHTVYGGGGITPDIFIPYDTANMELGNVKMYRKNILGNFVYSMYKQQATSFKSLKSTDELMQKFKPNDQNWQQLVSFAAKDSIRLDTAKPKEKEHLLQHMQALMARQLFRNEGYFEVINRYDEALHKALGSLK